MHPCITALCDRHRASLLKTLGVHFIRHPCLTRKLRVLAPAAPKIIPRLLSGRKCSGVVESCLLCWFRIVRNSGQALSRILAFAVVGVGARPCADSVRPLSCILCTFMNALWALRPCKAFGRSFYKASVPYPQVAGSPTHQHIKSVTPLIEWGYTFWQRTVILIETV